MKRCLLPILALVGTLTAVITISQANTTKAKAQVGNQNVTTTLTHNAPGTPPPLPPVGKDDDHNGLHDRWEIQNFGKTGIAPGEDADGDGLSNLQEFQAQTDPLKPHPGWVFFSLPADLVPLAASPDGIALLRDETHYWRWADGKLKRLGEYFAHQQTAPGQYRDSEAVINRQGEVAIKATTVTRLNTAAFFQDWTSESTVTVHTMSESTWSYAAPAYTAVNDFTDGQITDVNGNFVRWLKTRDQSNEMRPIALAEDGALWGKCVAGLVVSNDVESGHSVHFESYLHELAQVQASGVVVKSHNRLADFRGLDGHSRPIGSTWVDGTGGAKRYFVGEAEVAYEPLTQSFAGRVIGYANGGYAIYEPDDTVKNLPSNTYGHYFDQQERVNIYRSLLTPTGVTGAWLQLPYIPLPMPPGWSSNHQVSIGSESAQLGYASINGAAPQPFFAILNPASLAVDANRDGIIKLASEDASDLTTATKPYRFWINDDDDGNALNNETEVEGSTNPDYALRGDFGIASKRDLEDFARLWISSAGISDALKSGDMQIGLQWKIDTVTGAPAINFYRHYESDGSTRYLTENATAIQQTAPPYSTTLVDAGNKNVVSSTNGVFIFKKELFANLSSSQNKTFLLFEGAGVGNGQLQLLLLDKNGKQVGEGSGVWLDIRRINTMFERAKATTQYALSSDGIDATMPLPHDYIDPAQVPQPTMGWTADERGEAFVPDPSEDLQNKNYIVFVHGWRQAPGQGLVGVSSALTYARTMYKRFWHAGYKGRFAVFRWPTFYGGPEADDDDPLRGYTTYNDSEYRAWKAGQSLAQYVNQLPSDYKRRITAHSMGNIVAGSAFKYGMTADSYALLNAAVPALCYEETALRRWPTFTGIYGWLTSRAGYSIPSQSPNAPDSRTPVDDASPAIQALSYVRQLDAISAAADVVNFYLEADFATSISWNANNVIMRPHTVTLGRRYGYGWGDTDPGERLTLRDFPDQMIHRHPSDPHEVMAYDCKVPTFTVNATGGTMGSILRTVDMSTYGFNREHSAQWQWRFQQTAQFYQRLLTEFGLTPTL